MQELGGDVVIAYNAGLRLVEGWRSRSEMPDDLIVVADPDAQVYEALGTRRTDPVTLVAKSIVGGLKSARRGMVPKASRADMLRLGADVAVRADGEIALLHLAAGPDDRLPVEDLVAALRP